MNWMKRIVAIALCICMLGTLGGCKKSTKEIENLITEFEYSCNNLDIDAMLNCLVPDVADKIKLAVGVVGVFTDKDTDEIFMMISETLMNGENKGSREFFSSIKIEIDEIYEKDDQATVSVYITYNVSGDEYKEAATFKCVYQMEQWYIAAFTLEKN